MDLETAAKKRRERTRGPETAHESGLALTRDSQSRRAAEALAHRIAAWKRQPSIEDAVEAERHVPEEKLGGRTRAETDDWARAILDACED